MIFVAGSSRTFSLVGQEIYPGHLLNLLNLCEKERASFFELVFRTLFSSVSAAERIQSPVQANEIISIHGQIPSLPF
ncbi:hypothetical protein GE061_015957 [Apolygus lucorum]|uniref:Uncharacterized protein n=1 Tax=Apolygus lucorum TaxID=248454 RepID=A0A8S9XGU1_APOLU|nr:hypothetical protein GE061_015957 [Apolygus lucorum]